MCSISLARLLVVVDITQTLGQQMNWNHSPTTHQLQHFGQVIYPHSKPVSAALNHELPDVQAVFRNSRGTRDQITSIRWIIEKAREFHKNIYFCFIDYAKAFM